MISLFLTGLFNINSIKHNTEEIYKLEKSLIVNNVKLKHNDNDP